MAKQRPPRIKLTCPVCHKTVMLPPSIIAQGRTHCSAKCMGISKRKPVEVTCIGCKKVFVSNPSIAANRKYCNWECQKKHKKPRIVCIGCGKERRVTPSVLAQGARFCSWECARKVL